MTHSEPSVRGFATCASCGEEIIWSRNIRTGKVAPINARVSPLGNVGLLPDHSQYEVYGPAEAAKQRAQGAALHESHFAVCPRASAWRGGSKGKAGAS